MKDKPFGMPDSRIQRFYFNQNNGKLCCSVVWIFGIN